MADVVPAINEFGLQSSMAVATNDIANPHYGAYAMFDRRSYEAFEGDVLIIPSSIHECLLMDMNEIDPEMLQMVNFLIADVNENELEPNEILSNHAYVYHRCTDRIEAL